MTRRSAGLARLVLAVACGGMVTVEAVVPVRERSADFRPAMAVRRPDRLSGRVCAVRPDRRFGRGRALWGIGWLAETVLLAWYLLVTRIT